jgi:hypothetical protein
MRGKGRKKIQVGEYQSTGREYKPIRAQVENTSLSEHR